MPSSPVRSRIAQLAALLAFGLAAPASAAPGAASTDVPDWGITPAQVYVEGDSVHLYGSLDRDAALRLRQLLDEAAPTVTRLVIASNGGDALWSVMAAEAVHARNMEVVVAGKGCGSSCANYLFTPARKKTLSPGAMVLWHYSCPTSYSEDPAWWRTWLAGNYGQALKIEPPGEGEPAPDPAQVRQQFEAELDTHAQRFAGMAAQVKAGHMRIFAGSGIDERIMCLADHLALPPVPEGTIGYSYTLPVADMARFGVCNVSAPDDYVERTEAFFRSRQDLHGRFGVVRLSEHRLFKPRYGPGHCDGAARGGVQPAK